MASFGGSVGLRNFRSTDNATVAVTNSTGNVALTGQGSDFEFKNTGSVEAFVNVGASSSVTATAGGALTADKDGSQSVPAGAILVYSFPNCGATPYVAAITATGTTTLRVSQGFGS